MISQSVQRCEHGGSASLLGCNIPSLVALSRRDVPLVLLGMSDETAAAAEIMRTRRARSMC